MLIMLFELKLLSQAQLEKAAIDSGFDIIGGLWKMMGHLPFPLWTPACTRWLVLAAWDQPAGNGVFP